MTRSAPALSVRRFRSCCPPYSHGRRSCLFLCGILLIFLWSKHSRGTHEYSMAMFIRRNHTFLNLDFLYCFRIVFLRYSVQYVKSARKRDSVSPHFIYCRIASFRPVYPPIRETLKAATLERRQSPYYVLSRRLGRFQYDCARIHSFPVRRFQSLCFAVLFELSERRLDICRYRCIIRDSILMVSCQRRTHPPSPFPRAS